MKLSGLLSLKSFKLSSTPAKKEEVVKPNSEIDTGIYENDNEIYGTYISDLNLMQLNTMIVNRMTLKLKKDCTKFKQQLLLEKERIRQPQSKIERGHTIKLIQSKEREIQSIEKNEDLNSYTRDTASILEEYVKLGSYKKIKVLGREAEDENMENQILRRKLVDNFLDIAKEHVKLNIKKISTIDPNISICSNCLESVDVVSQIDECSVICPKCGLETQKLMRSYDEVSSPECKPKVVEYQDFRNFEECIDKFCGLSYNSKLDQIDIFSILDEHFESNSLLKGENIRENYEEFKHDYNRALMKNALKINKLNYLYSDIEYIMHLYWNKPLFNISHLKSQLLDDYKNSQPIYEKYKDPIKSSSMNVQYRLWRHLGKLGVHIDESNFNIPKSSFDYYEKIWGDMCEELGWTD